MTAVLLALGGALAFAVSNVLQHRAAADSGADVGRPLGLVARLLRQPAWLVAQPAAALGLALHAGALHAGRVVVVQPLLASGLVLSLVLGALVDRRRPGRPLPDRLQWLAAVVVAAGLALFLLAAQPAAGSDTASATTTTALFLVTLAVLAATFLWGRRPDRPHRALVLGIGAGTGFGTASLLLKQLVAVPLLSRAGGATVAELVVVGGISVLLAQWAYTAGSLIESLPVTTVLEPAIAVALAGPLFGEWLASGGAARAGQLAGALALVAGVVLLARRTAVPGAPERNAA
jgi:drug/metabolite transporter (DMT)-like permease